jgi:signal transduction histidine kinase
MGRFVNPREMLKTYIHQVNFVDVDVVVVVVVVVVVGVVVVELLHIHSRRHQDTKLTG